MIEKESGSNRGDGCCRLDGSLLGSSYPNRGRNIKLPKQGRPCQLDKSVLRANLVLFFVVSSIADVS